MKIRYFLLLAILIILSLHSCKKDSPAECIEDPRKEATGTYMMKDSVFFQDVYSSSLSQIEPPYALVIRLDTLTGDTILMENLFDFSLDLKAVYNSVDGSFTIPPQIDETASIDPEAAAYVSGSGVITSTGITYSASYSDGGYSFIGSGTK